jgi:hypothetical protein
MVTSLLGDNYSTATKIHAESNAFGRKQRFANSAK